MKYLSAVFVFVAGCFVHWLWASRMAPWGLAPHVVLALTVAAAGRSGPVAGQCYGFAWGLFADALGAHIFGAQALALTLVGYGVGSLRRQMDVESAPSQALLILLLVPVLYLFYGLAGLVFERTFLWVGWGKFLAIPFYTALVSPLGFGFVKRNLNL